MGWVVPAIVIALTSVGVGTALALTLAPLIAKLAAAAIINAISRASQKSPSQEDIAAELQQPDGLPAYRYAYGNCNASGTPAPADVVKGEHLICCFVVNSRPSAGDFTLYLDDREVELTGDPYDFSLAGGATATNEPFYQHIDVWFGRGDQVGPPAKILEYVPYEEGVHDDWFKATDGWQGRTVVWLRLHKGDQSNRGQRWPSKPPAVSVRNLRSRVWDPRDAAQDVNDPTTWQPSNNHGLIVLDALMQSPVAPYRLRNLMLDTFIWAADVADVAVELKGGGTEPQFEVGGILKFSDSELEDQLQPLLDAGGAQFIRVGGRLGIVPATWHDPVYTLTDVIGGAREYRALKRGKDLYNQVRTFYTSADRGFETADFGLWDIPGASAEGKILEQRLTYVTSGTQAQRLRQIAGRKALQQRSLKSIAPPEMIKVLPGGNVTVNLPGTTRMNGTYQATSVNPAVDPVGSDGGVALRVPFEFISTSPTIYEWDKDVDEEDILVPEFDSSFEGIEPPGEISVVTGPSVDLNTGGTVVPRVRFSASPSATASVDRYIWEYEDWSPENLGNWVSGGEINGEVRDSDGKVFGYLSGMSFVEETAIRMAAMRGTDQSEWEMIENVRLDFDVVITSTTVSPGLVQFDVTTPDNSSFDGLAIYRSDDSDFDNAVAISGKIAAAINSAATIQAGDPVAVDLLSNGDFADGSVWVAGSNWTISGGVAAHTIDTPSSTVSQPVAPADAVTLRWMFTVSSVSQGFAVARVEGDSNTDSALIGTVGVHHGVLIAPMNTTAFGVRAKVDTDIAIDEISLVVETAECVAGGPGFFWVVPLTQNNSHGPAVGPVQLNIP